MKFSVVIPLYNKELFVAGSIRSVLSQTHPDFELIIVDDCSADNSLKIAETFADSRLRIVKHAHNKGLSAARNTGVRYASSELITFLDADDLWLPEFLEKMAKLVRAFPNAGLYAANYVEQFGQARVHPKQYLEIPKGEMGIVSNYFEAALAQPILWYGSAVVKKSTFDSVGGFDESITLCEDVDFNIRANLETQLAFYNEPLAVYNVISQNQIMNASFAGKTYPDFDRYERDHAQNLSLKKYLDTNRYIFGMRFKMSGDTQHFERIVSKIDFKSLTFCQKFLLNAPIYAVRLLSATKQFLVRRGFRITSFR